MEKYFAFIFLLFPQLLLAQADGAGTEHGLRVGDELSREVVAFGGSETSGLSVSGTYRTWKCSRATTSLGIQVRNHSLVPNESK